MSWTALLCVALLWAPAGAFGRRVGEWAADAVIAWRQGGAVNRSLRE